MVFHDTILNNIARKFSVSTNFLIIFLSVNTFLEELFSVVTTDFPSILLPGFSYISQGHPKEVELYEITTEIKTTNKAERESVSAETKGKTGNGVTKFFD